MVQARRAASSVLEVHRADSRGRSTKRPRTFVISLRAARPIARSIRLGRRLSKVAWLPSAAYYPSSGDLIARQSYEHVSVSTRPRFRQFSEPHPSEVIFGRQLQAADSDDAPTRLKELVGLVDLEGTDGVERVVEDFAVGNRAENDAVVNKNVVHGQNASAGVSRVRDAAH